MTQLHWSYYEETVPVVIMGIAGTYNIARWIRSHVLHLNLRQAKTKLILQEENIVLF